MLLRIIGGILIVLHLTAAPLMPHVQAEEAADDHKIKAAFLFNFARYVNWPAAALGTGDAPFLIGILGNDPFNDSLAPFSTKSLKNRKVIVHHLSGPAEARRCHILFISDSERERLHDIILHLDRASVLTVSDMEGFMEAGGMIRLLSRKGKIRFQINLKATEAAGLQMSSQMLKLAADLRDE